MASFDLKQPSMHRWSTICPFRRASVRVILPMTVRTYRCTVRACLLFGSRLLVGRTHAYWTLCVPTYQRSFGSQENSSEVRAEGACTEDEGRRGRCCNFPSSPDSDGRAWSPLLRRETAAWLLRNRCTEKTPDLPTKVSSHHQASCGIVDASGRHRHACRIVLGCRTKAGPQLSRREAVPWSPMSTSEQTERPLRFHAPQRPPRRGGTSARGGPEAPRDNLIAVHRLPCDEFGLGPATSVTTALAPRPRRTSSCTESVGLDPFCRHDVEFPCCQ